MYRFKENWFYYLLLIFVVVCLGLIASMIYFELKYPCKKYSEETYTTFVMSGKVLIPIQSHKCLER